MSGTKSCANLPASQLVEWANTEAKQMSDLANKSMRDLDFAWRSGGKGMAAKSYFTTTFDQCCMAQVVCLRNEFIKRLGPKYKSADEEAAWQFLSDRDMDGFISNPMSVRDYAPYLQNGAEQLTRPHLAP